MARAAQEVDRLAHLEDQLLGVAAGAVVEPRLVGRDGGQGDQAARDREAAGRDPVGQVDVDPREDGRQRAAHEEAQHHREEHHRVGGQERLAGEQGGDRRRLGGAEELAQGAEGEGDHEQVVDVAAEEGDQLGERDQGDDRRPAEVGPDHRPLAVVAVGEDAREGGQEERRQRVGEKGHGDRGVGAAEVVGEDDQREHHELVGRLGGELGEPDEAEVGPREDVSEPFSAFEAGQGLHARLQAYPRASKAR